MQENIELLIEKIRNNQIIEYLVIERNSDKFAGTIETTELAVKKLVERRELIKTTWFVSMDLIQNIFDFATFNATIFTNSFYVAYFDNSFFVSAQNIMFTPNVSEFKNQLEDINSCFSKKNPISLLNKKYKSKLTAKSNDKKGAAVGLIDVARKSGNMLNYSFKQIDEKYTIFSIVCKIDNK